MTETPYNVDLMLQVREQITAHPETHNQERWAQRTECGTALCIAGWASVLTGREIVWHGDSPIASMVMAPGRPRQRELIRGAATTALGLDRYEAQRLFYARDNDGALALLDRFIEAGKNGERVCLG